MECHTCDVRHRRWRASGSFSAASMLRINFDQTARDGVGGGVNLAAACHSKLDRSHAATSTGLPSRISITWYKSNQIGSPGVSKLSSLDCSASSPQYPPPSFGLIALTQSRSPCGNRLPLDRSTMLKCSWTEDPTATIRPCAGFGRDLVFTSIRAVNVPRATSVAVGRPHQALREKTPAEFAHWTKTSETNPPETNPAIGPTNQSGSVQKVTWLARQLRGSQTRVTETQR